MPISLVFSDTYKPLNAAFLRGRSKNRQYYSTKESHEDKFPLLGYSIIHNLFIHGGMGEGPFGH